MMARLRTTVAALAIVLSTTSVGASPPEPSGPTMANLREEELHFAHETFRDVFTSRADLEAPWYADARAAVDGVVSRMAGLTERASHADLETWSRAAIEAGCEDPIVLYCLGYADNEYHSLVRAFEALKAHDDPVHRQAVAALRVAFVMNRGRAAEPYWEQGVQLLARAVEEDVFGPGRERLLVGFIHPWIAQDLPFEYVEMLEDLLRASERLDPWSRHCLLGACEIRAGWERRGKALAAYVTDEQWEGFSTHLNRAYRHLTRALEIVRDRPEPAAMLVSVAMGGSTLPGEDERYWFDRCVEIQVDWQPAYDRLTHALRPRWGGSYEELLAFARECKNTRRYDTRVPYFALDTLWVIADESNDHWIWSEDGVLDDIAEVTAGYARQPELVGAGLTPSYMRGLHAVTAWRTGDAETARAQIEAAGELSAAALRFMKAERDEVLGDVCALASRVGRRLAEAEAALQHGNAADAVALCEQALVEISALDASEQWPFDACDEAAIDIPAEIRHRLAVARLARDLPGGTSVPLTFDETLSGWTVVRGRWERIDERTIEGWPDKQGLMLLHDLPIGTRFEIDGRFHFPRATNRAKKGKMSSRALNVSVYSMARRGFDEPDFIQTTFNHRHDSVFMRRRGDLRGTVQVKNVTVGADGRFRVKIWDDWIFAYLDEQLVYAGERPDGALFVPGGHFGVGGYFWTKSSYDKRRVRISNLSVRLLTEPPDEDPRGPEDVTSAARKRIEQLISAGEPDDEISIEDLQKLLREAKEAKEKEEEGDE